MKIETLELDYSKKAFQRIVRAVTLHQTRNARILLLVFSFAISFFFLLIFLVSGKIQFIVFVLIYLTIATFYCLSPFLLDLTRIQPKINYQKKRWQIDENFVSTFYEDGSSTKTHIDNFLEVKLMAECYILYLSKKGLFQYLPIAAFKTEADRQEFHDFLVAKELLKT